MLESVTQAAPDHISFSKMIGSAVLRKKYRGCFLASWSEPCTWARTPDENQLVKSLLFRQMLVKTPQDFVAADANCLLRMKITLLTISS
jgi:hypothetical protein